MLTKGRKTNFPIVNFALTESWVAANSAGSWERRVPVPPLWEFSLSISQRDPFSRNTSSVTLGGNYEMKDRDIK